MHHSYCVFSMSSVIYLGELGTCEVRGIPILRLSENSDRPPRIGPLSGTLQVASERPRSPIWTLCTIYNRSCGVLWLFFRQSRKGYSRKFRLAGGRVRDGRR